MAYTLKTSGIATDLITCIAVNDDGATVTDFKAAGAGFVSTVASIGTATWAGVSRKYMHITDAGGYDFNGIKFSTTEPTVDEDAGMTVWFACAGSSARNNNGSFVCIGPNESDFRGLIASGAPPKGRYEVGGGTMALGVTTLPTDGTKFSLGATYNSGTESHIYYGVDGGSWAADDDEGPDGGYGTTRTIWSIGGSYGNGSQPFDPFIVCVFDRVLTPTEVESLHDDWFTTLFDAPASVDGSSSAGSPAGLSSMGGGLSKAGFPAGLSSLG